MTPFISVTSTAVLLPRANIDTDIIIPARHLKTITRAGLGRHAFESLRETDGIDRALDAGAQFILAGENFGCGSSREHAVWAIADLGIRAIIAPSFADIFRGNCKKNGVLAAAVDGDTWQALLDNVDKGGGEMTLDLKAGTITAGRVSYRFTVADDVREALLAGRDDIADTLAYEADIAAFEERQKRTQPWLYQPLVL